MRIKLGPIGSSIIGVAILAGFVYVLGWSSLITIQSIDIIGTNQKALITAQLVSGESKLVVNEQQRNSIRIDSNLGNHGFS